MFKYIIFKFVCFSSVFVIISVINVNNYYDKSTLIIIKVCRHKLDTFLKVWKVQTNPIAYYNHINKHYQHSCDIPVYWSTALRV